MASGPLGTAGTKNEDAEPAGDAGGGGGSHGETEEAILTGLGCRGGGGRWGGEWGWKGLRCSLQLD